MCVEYELLPHAEGVTPCPGFLNRDCVAKGELETRIGPMKGAVSDLPAVKVDFAGRRANRLVARRLRRCRERDGR